MSRPSFDEIRKQVQRRYSRWYWFVFHLIMAATIVAVVWKIDPTPRDGSPVLAALWSGVLLAHLAKVVMDELRDRAVQHAWEKYRYRDAVLDEDAEKPKRMMRLSDDAELEDIVEEIPEAEARRVNHRG